MLIDSERSLIRYDKEKERKKDKRVACRRFGGRRVACVLSSTRGPKGNRDGGDGGWNEGKGRSEAGVLGAGRRALPTSNSAHLTNHIKLGNEQDRRA